MPNILKKKCSDKLFWGIFIGIAVIMQLVPIVILVRESQNINKYPTNTFNVEVTIVDAKQINHSLTEDEYIIKFIYDDTVYTINDESIYYKYKDKVESKVPAILTTNPQLLKGQQMEEMLYSLFVEEKEGFNFTIKLP